MSGDLRNDKWFIPTVSPTPVFDAPALGFSPMTHGLLV